MTISELIAHLKKFNGDAKLLIDFEQFGGALYRRNTQGIGYSMNLLSHKSKTILDKMDIINKGIVKDDNL